MDPYYARVRYNLNNDEFDQVFLQELEKYEGHNFFGGGVEKLSIDEQEISSSKIKNYGFPNKEKRDSFVTAINKIEGMSANEFILPNMEELYKKV